jgi:hypothetical protein
MLRSVRRQPESGIMRDCWDRNDGAGALASGRLPEVSHRFPSACQVVLRSAWSDNLRVSYEYVAHAVMAR